jgi:predicted acyltransferase
MSSLEPVTPAVPRGRRLLSLDVFRGATVMFMILVNNPGVEDRAYWLLNHGHGYDTTPADWVFPFFLFIVGVALAFSLDSGKKTTGQIIKRAGILFGAGMLLNIYPKWNFDTWRVMGVLQRIAICYLGVSLMARHLSRRGQVIALFLLLGGYWAAMIGIPFAGKGENPFDLEFGKNVCDWIDGNVLGPFLYKPYQGDLKGLWSTLPAMATTLIGYFAGVGLVRKAPTRRQAAHLLAAGLVAVAFALLLEPVMPFSQRLWTSSYALYTSGLALVGFALVYGICDVRGARAGTRPFVIFGSNALVAWCGSVFLAKTLAYFGIDVALFDAFSRSLSAENSALLHASLHLGLWYAILALLYRRGWFVKV